MTIFVSRLNELRGEMSVAAFARSLNMPQNTLDCYIKGRRKPSVDLLIRVCDKCGVSADWLLGLSDNRDGSQSTAKRSSPSPEGMTSFHARREPSLSDVMTELKSLSRCVSNLYKFVNNGYSR